MLLKNTGASPSEINHLIVVGRGRVGNSNGTGTIKILGDWRNKIIIHLNGYNTTTNSNPTHYNVYTFSVTNITFSSLYTIISIASLKLGGIYHHGQNDEVAPNGTEYCYYIELFHKQLRNPIPQTGYISLENVKTPILT